MSFARIQPITDKLSCKAGETVECAFDVFNSTNETIKLGAEPKGELADANQISLKGASEIELPANGQEKVLVTITVPADAAPAEGGKTRTTNFSLRIYNVRDTEQTVESKAVAVEVKARPVVVTGGGPTGGGGGSKLGLIIGCIVGGLVLLGGGGIGIYFLLSGPDEVPDVVDLTSDDALEVLEEAGLSAVISEISSEDVDAEPGIITGQDPAAGEDVPEGNEIALVMEPASVSTPNLVGMTVPAAAERLIAVGLALGEKTFERGGLHPGGAVTAQSPAPGERALPDQEIAVTVELAMVAVPDVKGMALSAATQVLSSSGLEVGETTEGRGDGEPGSVIGQDPESETEVERGSIVNVTFKEQPIKMSNLVGKTVESATMLLTRQGLKVDKVNTTYTNNANYINKITAHTPGPNADAYVGSDVQLTVGRKKRRPGTIGSVTLHNQPGISVIAMATSSKTCANAVQNKIAWDYKGSKSWAAGNVARLCKGAESSRAPASCFQTIMHGGVSYGSGNRWSWKNAINLCAGATNANTRVQCFKSKIAARQTWQNAISQCNKTLYKPQIAHVRNLSAE